MSRELDEACTRALHLPHEAGCPAIADDESDEVLSDFQRCVCDWPRFSTDPAMTTQLFADIERRGLHEAYATALDKIVMGTNADAWDEMTDALWIWALLRATPEQHTRAFLEATTEGQQ